MIDNRTIRTTTKPIVKLAHWQNGQTAKRLTVAADKRTIGCMSRHKAIRKANEMTVQPTACVSAQSNTQANRQPRLYVVNRTDGQLTALAAISIIN